MRGKGAASIWGAFSRKLSGEVFSVREGRGGAEEEVPAGEGDPGKGLWMGKTSGQSWGNCKAGLPSPNYAVADEAAWFKE